MAQVLKEDVQRLIRQAALAAFAEEGFGAATIAKIAARAGVSTGNVYRYFENKEVLFLDVVPESLARELSRLLRKRVEAARGLSDPRKAAGWNAISAELLDLAIANRLAVVVLLDAPKASGTAYEGFAGAVVDDLVALALVHARSVSPGFEPTPAERVVLDRVYRGLVETVVAILQRCSSADAIRAAVDRFGAYHLAGLKALLERT
jgi:AcrR family transcriptional regulator